MKRTVFGVSLLVALLVLSLAVTVLMARIHEPLAEELTQAAALAAGGDWAGARALAEKAGEDWERLEPIAACFADHTPLEEIGQGFAQVEVFGKTGEQAAFAAACADLAEKMQAMSDAHSLHWQNLF